MSELKPCPFCGGEVELIDMTHDGVGNPYSIQCKTGWCLGHTNWYPRESKLLLVREWNTRNNEALKLELIEAFASDYKVSVLVQNAGVVSQAIDPNILEIINKVMG